ncbi:MAG: VapC toxin family PIN domain ribonuclease [Acidobacteria bacterium]|nr:MAG: VapC toxin family PIN domain ribonuclease [Acidobacteriota bacterium]
MLALDVNVLVDIVREGAEQDEVRRWLQDVLAGGERVGVSDAVLTGALRVLTHPRVFDPPASLDDAADALSDLVRQPGIVVLKPLPGCWETAVELARAAGAHGNLVADAAHAAVAVQHGATFVTRDQDFRRFPGLQVQAPV